jgi:predicted transposase/invertase (TIGR01784 family)
MSDMEKWGLFFGYADNPRYKNLLRELITSKEEIRMATEVLTNISKDDRERARFRSRKMFLMDREHDLAVARKEGRKEERIEVARNMLRRNRPINEIAEDTSLSRAEIEALRQ